MTSITPPVVHPRHPTPNTSKRLGRPTRRLAATRTPLNMSRAHKSTHQPAWLARDLGVPLLVSHRRLAGRRSLPRATGPWALDSGGFTELSLYGEWRTDARTYVTAVRRYSEEIGHLDWARARTGWSNAM